MERLSETYRQHGEVHVYNSIDTTRKMCVHVLMRDERRKEERRKQDQTNNKAKQHSAPKAVTFPGRLCNNPLSL